MTEINSDEERVRFEEFIRPLISEIQNLYDRFELTELKRQIELKILDKKTVFKELDLSKVSVHWTKEKICFYVYQENLEKYFSYLKQQTDAIDSNQLLVEIAQHEYGHILTTDSIEDYDKLKSIDSDINGFLRVFEEFYASKKFKEFISIEPPMEIIKSNLITLRDVSNYQLEPIIGNLFSILHLTIDSYIFKQFDEILSKFRNFSDLFNLIYKIHKKLDNIVESLQEDNLSNVNLKNRLVILLEWIRRNL